MYDLLYIKILNGHNIKGDFNLDSNRAALRTKTSLYGDGWLTRGMRQCK
jgi:hypothetical protein